jgi:Domain of unknown function (DUF4157)/Concanavalin A-like lectin/glucanases superfamily
MAMGLLAQSRLDRARKARHEGGPLPAELRERLEGALGADLSAVRVHTGPAADAAARAFGADAVTTGSMIFFRAGAYLPAQRAGLRLLAHEVAHTVQQAVAAAETNGRGLPVDTVRAEAMADRFADAFLDTYAAGPCEHGELAFLALGTAGRGRHRRELVAAGPSGSVQLHASFEHRYLGDGAPEDLRLIAYNHPQDQGRRDQLIKDQIRLFELFDRADPGKVTEEDVKRAVPSGAIQTILLGPDKVVATLGEVNALPDYLSNPAQVDSVGADLLLPILQVIRQEGYNEFTALLPDTKNPYKRFPLSPFQPTGALWGLLNSILETAALDQLTAGLGIGGQDHYAGLLARNACHFAPYSWYRWSAFHEAARQTAKEAFQATGERKQELIRKAWNLAGYADHFLEDSFAAGHLIDKTLVMQWFVEWAEGSDLVADEGTLAYLSAALQPGLAAGKLYDPTYQGPSHDPQTVQELPLRADRAARTGLRPGREDGPLSGYLDYLTFLTSAAAQLGSNLLHNNYNSNALWVASAAHPQPYRLWGDGTLLSHGGGEGAYNTAETARLSRQAIKETIDRGETPITPARIRSAFPTAVGSDPNKLGSIAQWATEQRPFVEEKIFKGFEDEIGKALLRMATPRLGIVSRDEPLGQKFATRTDADVDAISYEQAAVLAVGDRLFAASRGFVFELDPVSGEPLKGRTQVLPHVSVDATSTLASDGKTLFIGNSARVHGLPLDGGAPWYTDVLGNSLNRRTVSLLVTQGRLFAASHGFVWELDPTRNRGIQHVALGGALPVGEYPVDLAADGDLLYAGTHGYVHALSLRQNWNGKALWESAGLGDSLISEPVAVLVENGRLFAVSNAWAYELPRDASRRILQKVYLDNGRYSLYVPSLASDAGRLYIGLHGAAYAVALDAPWGKEPEWSSPALSNLGEHGPSTVLYRHDRLFAGCDGYIYELDLLDGGISQFWQLSYLFTTALDLPTDLSATDQNLYIGLHGYAYGMLFAGILPRPAAVWPLSQVSGTAVPDQRGIHPANAVNVTWQPLPPLGTCARFNGVSSSINTASPVLDTAPDQGFTVEAWVRLDSTASFGNSAVVSQVGTQAAAFTLGCSPTGEWIFERSAGDAANPTVRRVASGVNAAYGVWTHLAAVYDPKAQTATPGATTAQLRIHVDGAWKRTLDLGPGFGFAARGALQIGSTRSNGSSTGWLNGAVRDVRVYRQALDELQLEPRAAAFWRLAEQSGRTAADRRRRHDAVAADVHWGNVPGIGYCATLNGRSSAITTKDPVLDTAVGGSFTVAAWVRLDSLPTAPAVLLGQDAQRVSAFSLRAVPSAGGTATWSFARQTADSDGNPPISVSSPVRVTAGTWAHVAGVYNAASGEMTIYLNGSQPARDGFPPRIAFPANGPFTIGYGRSAGTVSGRLHGTVRDVRAYQQALSAQQVKAILADTGISGGDS